AVLEMLNILEQFSPAKAGPLSGEELHKRIEAMKLAYADLAQYNADPRFAKVPVAGLLSKEYAKQRAQLINPRKANCSTDAGRPRVTRRTSRPWTEKAISSRSSRVTTQVLARASRYEVWDSRCRIAEPCLCWTLPSLTRSPVTSARSTPSFRPSWSAATTTSGLASWAAPTSHSRTPNSCPMWSI